MKKIKTQVLHNLKKEKGSYISFGIILLFTAFMLNLALVLTLQVDRAYEAKFETLRTANINICIPKVQNTEQLVEDIENIKGVKEVESREAILSEAVVREFRDTEFSMRTIFYNMDDERTVNQLEIKEDKKEVTDRSIYLPLYVASFGEFETDEEITYEIDGKMHTFLVSGVVEEMQYGNYGKGMMGAYLPERVYQQFAKGKEQNTVIEYSIITKENADIKSVEKEIGSLLSSQEIMILSNSDNISTKATRTMVCNLLIVILTAFAVVILLVSLFLCKFRIRNSIEEEMTSMGVLKAMGYTGNMIVGSMVLPYVIVTVIASLMGVIVSYGILPTLSQVLTLQSGFSFTLIFDVKGLICVGVVLMLIVIVFTYGAANPIKKVQPINAIRGNGREMICSGQNVLLFFISFVLTILVAFAGTMFYNVIVKPDNFMSTLSEEMPDVILYSKDGYQKQLEEALQGMAKVEKILSYTTGNVKINDGSVTVFACEDFNKVSNDLCFLGENPQSENQVALGSIFEENYQVGDTIEIENGDITRSYEITGFVQSVNFQGNVCELTMEGYEALVTENNAKSLYVYIEEGEDASTFVKDFEKNYVDIIVKIVNSQEMEETSQDMFSGITMVLIAVIFGLTVVIVLFILYIVIKSLLVQRKQELGIYKAIGYSNWQLMVLMAGSFLPVSIAAVLLSSALALFYMPYMNQCIFQTVGAMKNNMEVSFAFLMIFAVIQIIMNVGISICLMMPIKKISAYALIKE